MTKKKKTTKVVPISEPLIFADYYGEFRDRVLAMAAGEWSRPSAQKGWPKVMLYQTNVSKNMDKEYQVAIVETCLDPQKDRLGNQLFDVMFGFGKRNTSKLNNYKARSVTLSSAKNIYDEIVAEKKRGGYTTNKSGIL